MFCIISSHSTSYVTRDVACLTKSEFISNFTTTPGYSPYSQGMRSDERIFSSCAFSISWMIFVNDQLINHTAAGTNIENHDATLALVVHQEILERAVGGLLRAAGIS